MVEEKKRYHKGDKVEESGKYVCDICNTEGGVDAHEFHKGEEFPACMNCGDTTQWKKTEEDE
jgi:hypothetical protein